MSQTRYEVVLSPRAKRAIERDLPEAVAFAVVAFLHGPLAEDPYRDRQAPSLGDYGLLVGASGVSTASSTRSTTTGFWCASCASLTELTCTADAITDPQPSDGSRVLMWHVPPRTQPHPGVSAGQEPGVSCCRGRRGPRDTRVLLRAREHTSPSPVRSPAGGNLSGSGSGCGCWRSRPPTPSPAGRRLLHLAATAPFTALA